MYAYDFPSPYQLPTSQNLNLLYPSSGIDINIGDIDNSNDYYRIAVIVLSVLLGLCVIMCGIIMWLWCLLKKEVTMLKVTAQTKEGVTENEMHTMY